MEPLHPRQNPPILSDLKAVVVGLLAPGDWESTKIFGLLAERPIFFAESREEFFPANPLEPFFAAYFSSAGSSSSSKSHDDTKNKDKNGPPVRNKGLITRILGIAAI